MNEYYIYVYLDSRKPGKYSYEHLGITFLYEPIYIGKGTKYRMQAHLYKSALKKTLHFPSVLRKIIGANLLPINFIIIDKLSEESAFENEIKFIKNIGRKDLKTGTLLNFTDGGSGGCGGKVKRKLSPQGLINLCIARKLNPTTKGKKWSEEHKKKISEANKGKKLSEDHKKKLSEAKKGKSATWNKHKLTEEHKLKLSLAKKGKSLTEEHRNNISNGLKNFYNFSVL